MEVSVKVEGKSIKERKIKCNAESRLEEIFNEYLEKTMSEADKKNKIKNKIDINDYIFYIDEKEIKKDTKIKEIDVDEDEKISITLKKNQRL